MADLTKIFEEQKEKADNLKQVLEDAKSSIKEVRDIELEINSQKEEQAKIQKQINRLRYEEAKLDLDGRKLDDNKLRILNELEQKQENYNKLVEKQKEQQNIINNALKEEERRLKEGYTWLDKKREAFEQIGGGAFLKGAKQLSSGAKEVFNAGKQFLEPWGKADQAAANYAKSIGLSKKGMDNLRKSTIDFVVSSNIGGKYNKSVEELIKLQQDYSVKVGRSISMTNRQKESLAAMTAVMGDQTALELTSKLENFGLSAEDAGKRVGKMFSNASKNGLSFEAYSKNFLENIKIAQNYTFKNGLRGLASMAEKATAIKLNMSQASAFADKVSTVEGAIKTGAQLQVLGGPFAQFANPMSMLYEGLNDMEGLQDRIVNMFGNLGKFDTKTGEMNVSSFNKMRIRQAAEATGMDYSNIMEMVNAKGKRNAIGDLNGFSDEQKEMLYNKATFNQESQKWGISDNKGNFKAIDQLSKNSPEMAYLADISKSESEDIKDIAQTLRGWDDSVSGLGKQKDAVQAQLAENMGIGRLAKYGVQQLSNQTFLLKTLVTLQTASAILGGVGNIVGGGMRMGQGGRNVLKGLGKNSSSNPTLTSGKTYSTTSNGGKIFKSNGRSYSGAAAESHFNKLQTRAENINKIKMTNRFGRFAKPMSKIGKTLSKYGKFAKGAGVTAGIFSALSTGMDEFGSNNNHSTAKKIGRTTGAGTGAFAGAAGGAALGAALGSFVPIIGTAIGGALGAAIGGLGGTELGKWIGGGFTSDKRRNKKKEEFDLTELQGDYSVAQLKRIKRSIATGDKTGLKDKDFKALEKNGELDLLNQKIQTANMTANSVTISSANPVINEGNYQNEVKYANGGLLNGPSHSKGGMRILGTNKTVEGGEFIVNKESTKKHFGELTKINSDTNSIQPIEPLGKIMKVLGSSSVAPSSVAPSEIKINPIDINLNGTIKLDTGKQNIDITKDITSNPVFIRTLTDMITKQMNINNNGSFNKDNFKQRWE